MLRLQVDVQNGGRDGEQIQHGIDHPLGARQGRQGTHRRRRLGLLVIVAASFRSQYVAGQLWCSGEEGTSFLYSLSGHVGASSLQTPLSRRQMTYASGIDGIYSPKISVSFCLACRLMVSKALRFTARLAPLFTPRMAPGMLDNPSTPPFLRPYHPDRADSRTKSLKKPPPPWVGTIARQPGADHATCLKCNVTMVSPLPNCVSATCVSIMSNTSLRTSIYLKYNGSKY